MYALANPAWKVYVMWLSGLAMAVNNRKFKYGIVTNYSNNLMNDGPEMSLNESLNALVILET